MITMGARLPAITTRRVWVHLMASGSPGRNWEAIVRASASFLFSKRPMAGLFEATKRSLFCRASHRKRNNWPRPRSCRTETVLRPSPGRLDLMETPIPVSSWQRGRKQTEHLGTKLPTELKRPRFPSPEIWAADFPCSPRPRGANRPSNRKPWKRSSESSKPKTHRARNPCRTAKSPERVSWVVQSSKPPRPRLRPSVPFLGSQVHFNRKRAILSQGSTMSPFFRKPDKFITKRSDPR